VFNLRRSDRLNLQRLKLRLLLCVCRYEESTKQKQNNRVHQDDLQVIAARQALAVLPASPAHCCEPRRRFIFDGCGE
jgi:hypothetical protein